MALTYLELLKLCNNFREDLLDEAFTFRFKDYELGHVLPEVAHALGHGFHVESKTLRFRDEDETDLESRTALISKTVNQWRNERKFKPLDKWRNELYPVYAPDHTILFTIERAASVLFGVTTFGVHMTGYTTSPLRIWVPTRAAGKTYGLQKDNTVAGGIGFPYGVFDTLVKECEEEASLDAAYVREHAKPVGAISYYHVNEETKYFQPECEYVFDLPMADIVPKPNDDEVLGFQLCSVEEVKQLMFAGQFKYNCSIVLIDFFIRHGIITPDEPDYIRICQLLRTRSPFPQR